MAFEANRQDRFGVRQIARVDIGQVREEGMNGGKPIVARGHGVVPVLLQVIQEAADYIRRQILQCQTRARFAMTLAGELQK